jgi:serine protease
MLQIGMNRFSLPVLSVSLLLCLCGAEAQAQSSSTVWPHGLLVQLRPGAVATDEVSTVLLRDTPQAHREQALANWQRRHTRQAAYLQTVAGQVDVPVQAIGSAGSALRLDLGDLKGRSPEAVMRRLRLHPDVLSVEPNVRIPLAQAASVVPNDPLFAQQWYLQAPSAQPAGIRASAAWARSTGTANPVTVAVVDTGVRFDHPDLAGRLWPGYDFVSELDVANDGDGRDADASDPGDWVTLSESKTAAYAGCEVIDSSWHGTAIAGLIAAGTNNGVGVSGVNWGAKVLPVRVAGKCGAVLSDLLDGLRWAAGLPVAGAPTNPNPAHIINLSYGGSGACSSNYQTTINEVRAAGALVVVAAGNSGAPLTRPADCSGVMPVTAVRADGAKTAYASYGTQVALAAPGGSAVSGTADVGLLTTHNSGRQGPVSTNYAVLAGTSFAAPLAAGVAGLMLSARPDLTPDEVMALMRGAARTHTVTASLAQCQATALTQGACNCTTQTCGAGLLDADASLAAAQAYVRGVTVIPTPTPTSSGGGGAMGKWWGLALWGWLGLLAWGQRRGTAQG